MVYMLLARAAQEQGFVESGQMRPSVSEWIAIWRERCSVAHYTAVGLPLLCSGLVPSGIVSGSDEPQYRLGDSARVLEQDLLVEEFFSRIKRKDVEWVQHALEHYPELGGAMTPNGESPLVYCLQQQDYGATANMALCLIDSGNCDLLARAPGDDAWSPLVLAVRDDDSKRAKQVIGALLAHQKVKDDALEALFPLPWDVVEGRGMDKARSPVTFFVVSVDNAVALCDAMPELIGVTDENNNTVADFFATGPYTEGPQRGDADYPYFEGESDEDDRTDDELLAEFFHEKMNSEE
jgi:hypothetical protein